MAIIPFPQTCGHCCSGIVQSSWWTEPLVAQSTGLLTRNQWLTDQGSLQRAEMVLRPEPMSCCQAGVEAWIRAMHGGVHTTKLWDFDYELKGPYGTGRSMRDYVAALTRAQTLADALTWQGFDHNWTNGTSWGLFPADLALASAAGDQIVITGGWPDQKFLCAGDRVTINGAVYTIQTHEFVGRAGRMRFTLDRAVPPADSYDFEIGGRVEVEMRLMESSREGLRAMSDKSFRREYRLEFREAVFA